MKRHIGRISYMHFKDIDPDVKARAIANRTGFYEACGQGIFCNLGKGDVDFPAVRQVLLDAGFDGWCTVEQDCDPTLDVSPVDDARANREYLSSIGFN
jgi:inosose dehydratase